MYSPRSIGVLLIAALPRPVMCLWPQPQTISTGSVALRLSTNFAIQPPMASSPVDLMDAISRTESFLKNDKLERLVVGRGAADADAVAGARVLSSLRLELGGDISPTAALSLKSITDDARALLESRNEAYSLQIPADGSAAVLRANSSLGLFRGLTTFSQLWYWAGGVVYTIEAPISINDSPAYPYRGFMLDTARNFFPVPDILRTLDAMSWVKMSTLHWHISDSQSFPLEVPGFMEISEKGAYSKSSVYTPIDVQNVVDYAGSRGIDILVEIDTPGHSSIISASHPEFVACAVASPWAVNAAGNPLQPRPTLLSEPPSGQLRLATPAVVNFTAELFSAVAGLFPSTMLSTGGDEVNNACYANDPETQAALNATGQTVTQALNTFVNTMHDALRSRNKTPVVWEEMLLDYGVTLNNDTIIMVWISSQNAASVAQKGFRFIHAASDYFYLDCGAGEWLGNDVSGNSWCAPFKTWQHSYTFNPTENLAEDEAKLVLGGQHLLWTEQSSPANLDSITWPRAAASAEVFWSGAGRDLDSALPRLHDLGYRMVQRGVQAIKLQPEWCALRPGACDD
ncbi:glycoside hydrolase family 20 protein [Auriscalpium vulgare]|uniref:Glycoside hydrolase family 20 protein n=1 Tax=Auriscalpium vulgare TaxID=40419 RepID=A0ACB8RZ32_9AGAM|nr:glycoside hydrolase family 20 protein [Auriscalpium vulgare]